MLPALKVLVIRKGDYGQYMAINFDFDQWGRSDKSAVATIDSCSLLLDNTAEEPNTPDLSTTITVTTEPSVSEQATAQCRAEYQEASADCIQMERNIKMMAAMNNISFEESLIKLELKPWWEKIKARFYAAKEALSLLPSNEVVSAL